MNIIGFRQRITAGILLVAVCAWPGNSVAQQVQRAQQAQGGTGAVEVLSVPEPEPDGIAVLRISASAINALIARSIASEAKVDRLVGPQRVTGDAATEGKLSFVLSPDTRRAACFIKFAGVTTARTTARREYANVQTTTVCRFRSYKPITITPAGLRAFRCQTFSNTQSRTDGIQVFAARPFAAEAVRLFNEVAAEAFRGEANRIAELDVKTNLDRQMSAAVDPQVSQWNEQLAAYWQPQQEETALPAEPIRYSTTKRFLQSSYHRPEVPGGRVPTQDTDASSRAIVEFWLHSSLADRRLPGVLSQINGMLKRSHLDHVVSIPRLWFNQLGLSNLMLMGVSSEDDWFVCRLGEEKFVHVLGSFVRSLEFPPPEGPAPPAPEEVVPEELPAPAGVPTRRAILRQ